MKFYVTNRLSENMMETPEGFLLCIGVPIARTGVQEYLPEEVGVSGGDNGMVLVRRDEAEVFRPETIASFTGKPVTIDHPGEGVTPENWKSLAVGICTNVRRGAGEESDLLLADLMLTDERAISLVLAGLREVSCGYDTEYFSSGAGEGEQRNIIGNHIALVSEGRCGSRCAIRDEKRLKERPMAKKTKASLMDSLMRLLRLADAIEAAEETEKPAAKEEAKKAEEGEKPSDACGKDQEEGLSLEGLAERLERIEVVIEKILAAEKSEEHPELAGEDEENPEGKIVGEDEDPDVAVQKPTGDAKAKWQDIKARAEIISPGIVLRGNDACTAKRHALSRAYIGDTKALIERFTGGPVKAFKALDCATLDAAFIGVSEFVKEFNNRGGSKVQRKAADNAKLPVTIAQINAANRDFWAKQNQ